MRAVQCRPGLRLVHASEFDVDGIAGFEVIVSVRVWRLIAKSNTSRPGAKKKAKENCST